MDSTSPLTASNSLPLPPMPMRGTRDAAPSADDFTALLSQEGLKAPRSPAEAQITAAQIASKAGVNARAKREPVLAGMQHPVSNAAAANETPALPGQPGRFMPLRGGPAGARAFTTPAQQSSPSNSLAGMRAVRKFAPGPVINPSLAQAVPAVARTLPDAIAMHTNTSAPAISAAKAAEAYNYGLQTAKPAQSSAPAEPPAWFGDAMQNGLEKYDAMKAAPQ